MNRLLTRAAVLAAIAVTLLSPMVFGQGRSKLRVQIPFDFKAGGKQLPAGTYTFSRDSNSVTVSGAETKAGAPVKLLAITYIARSNSSDDHLLAFDKVGDEKVLSEVWLPDQDGLVVFAHPGEHKHEVVRLNAKGGGR